jgi:hypothetical protein
VLVARYHPDTTGTVIMPKRYRLKALDTFACIGSDCPGNCCQRNWYIDVDNQTYSKWQHLDDTDTRQRLLEKVETVVVNDEETYRLKKDLTESCPHLSQDRLCSIQQQFGADMIPAVCREYPRIKGTNKQWSVHSANLSCPEIARIVLFADEDQVYNIQGDSPRPLGKGATADKVLWYFDRTANKVLADKAFPLNFKLTFLARMLADVGNMNSNRTLNEDVLKSFMNDYQVYLKNLQRAVANKEFATHPANARYMWYVIVTALSMNDPFNNKLGINELVPELLGLHRSSSDNPGSDDPFVARIQSYKQAAQPLAMKYNSAFKRYLQTVFVSKNFPWKSGSQGCLDAFLHCLIPFASIQLATWLFIEQHGQLTEQDLVAIVYNIEERFGHNSEIMTNIQNNQDFYRLDLYYDWFLDIM